MRSNRLDVLRAIAVFLVLGRHVYFSATWLRAGWMGVDLFFVLSGFLVTGLLLAEQRKNGRMHPLRFWLRRGFKIYPPFYALVLASVVTGIHQTGHLLPEALFYQNYAHGWWHHTWSLAVEEHFYFLLPVTLWLLARNDQSGEPFRRLPWVIGGVAALVLALRIFTVRTGSPSLDGPAFFFRNVCPTHLRIDSLAFGALISYLYHYKRAFIVGLDKQKLALLAAVSAVLIAPPLFVEIEGSRVMASVGLTALYLGFGGLLVAFMQWPAAENPPGIVSATAKALGYVGRHSYSIYLWHLPVKLGTEAAFARWAPHLRDQVVFVVYVAISVGVGVALAKLIEDPSLRLRDRLIPREARSLPSAAA
jgi:peptidoglycan/LPS O-acetylase OafA/YrhL